MRVALLLCSTTGIGNTGQRKTMCLESFESVECLAGDGFQFGDVIGHGKVMVDIDTKYIDTVNASNSRKGRGKE